MLVKGFAQTLASLVSPPSPLCCIRVPHGWVVGVNVVLRAS